MMSIGAAASAVAWVLLHSYGIRLTQCVKVGEAEWWAWGCKDLGNGWAGSGLSGTEWARSATSTASAE